MISYPHLCLLTTVFLSHLHEKPTLMSAQHYCLLNLLVVQEIGQSLLTTMVLLLLHRYDKPTLCAQLRLLPNLLVAQ